MRNGFLVILLTLLSLNCFGRTIEFCIANDRRDGTILLDTRIYFYSNYEMACDKQVLTGNKLMLFTQEHLDFGGTKCGFENACVIPVQKDGKALVNFYIGEGRLIPSYQ